jgi:DNA-binding response OmpR family regulator
MRLWLLCDGVATRADDIAESYVIGGHMRNRRAKLENFDWRRSITTVRGRGYRFCWQSQRPVEVTA